MQGDDVTTKSDYATDYAVALTAANGVAPSGQSFDKWKLVSDDSDATSSLNSVIGDLSVYPTFSSVTKYAVQIYGIGQDGDNVITFGPANQITTKDSSDNNVNVNYKDYYITHSYNSEGHLIRETRSGSNNNLVYSEDLGITRTTAEQASLGATIHDKTWAEIHNTTNKSIFTDEMLCGDTKCVELTMNSTIKGSDATLAGDGAGALTSSINGYYLRWNPNSNQNSAATNGGNTGSNAKDVGGYSISHIRATLVGSAVNETYAGDVNLNTDNCLFSCIESGLRTNIVSKNVKYYNNGSISTDINDKIWLFSYDEIFGGTLHGSGKAEGTQYQKYSDENSKNKTKILANESGYAIIWWLRSHNTGITDYVNYVNRSGSISYDYPYSACGVAFGFCL